MKRQFIAVFTVQSNLAIRNGLIRNKLVLRNHFLWPICHLLHKDKELLALRNNFTATKKFPIAKFDCMYIILNTQQPITWNSNRESYLLPSLCPETHFSLRSTKLLVKKLWFVIFSSIGREQNTTIGLWQQLLSLSLAPLYFIYRKKKPRIISLPLLTSHLMNSLRTVHQR